MVDYILAMGDNSTLSRQSMKKSSAVDLNDRISKHCRGHDFLCLNLMKVAIAAQRVSQWWIQLELAAYASVARRYLTALLIMI